MSIKTNELQEIKSVLAGDSLLIDSVSEGTGRCTFGTANQYFMDNGDRFPCGPGGVPYGREISTSWTELRAKTKEGDFSGVHYGDYKTIQLSTGETVVAEVAGIDQYYNCGDQAIGHHLDFISRDALKGAKTWNETATNNSKDASKKNPWLVSRLYSELNTTVFNTLPEELQGCIIEKRALIEERYGTAGDLTKDSGWSWQNIGKLWLPTEVEVFGCTHWSEPGFGSGGGGCNIQYPIFKGGSKHIIKGDGHQGGRTDWWELSVHSSSSTNVCVVIYDGDANRTSAAYSYVRSPLCFRIG